MRWVLSLWRCRLFVVQGGTQGTLARRLLDVREGEEMTVAEKANVAYELLEKIARKTWYPINYGVLSALVDHPAHYMGPVLDQVARKCQERDEPDLTSFVVLGGHAGRRAGEPGNGYGGPRPARNERHKCYTYFSSKQTLTGPPAAGSEVSRVDPPGLRVAVERGDGAGIARWLEECHGPFLDVAPVEAGPGDRHAVPPVAVLPTRTASGRRPARPAGRRTPSGLRRAPALSGR